MKVYVIYQVSYDNDTIIHSVVSSMERVKEIIHESPYLEYDEFELDAMPEPPKPYVPVIAPLEPITNELLTMPSFISKA